MSDDIAIRVTNLSKKYVLHRRASADGLRHAIQERVLSPFRSAVRHLGGWRSASNSREQIEKGGGDNEFWALRDISFEVRKGEVVGIIGRNGAGKSTLLKLLSRITEPNSGRIEINGRVASLLEVGTGFHHELSGRENIFLNGAILGMTRAEVRRRFDEIVAFAEVEAFLDTPVKHYSSGMYVRLAFAVAAHLEPEILIVDEVLAVGDSQFQEKCIAKMNEVSRRDGRSVLVVSHNLDTVGSLCTRGVLLQDSRLAFSGPIAEAINRYARSKTLSARTWTGDLGDEHARLVEVEVLQDGATDGPLIASKEIRIRLKARLTQSIVQLIFGYVLFSEFGYPLVFSLHDDCVETASGRVPPGVIWREFVIPPDSLASGRYDVGVALGIHNVKTIVPVSEHLVSFGVVNPDGIGLRHRGASGRGITSIIRPAWPVRSINAERVDMVAVDLGLSPTVVCEQKR